MERALTDILALIDSVDITIFVILVVVNIVFWKKLKSSCLVNGSLFLMLGIVLPLMSSSREVSRNVAINGPAMDNFELAYTFSLFPVYWLILAFQVMVLISKNTDEESGNINGTDRSEK
ncbi:MAG: hypothetical protein R3D00_04045 [Bacteroidia bacterium]